MLRSPTVVLSGRYRALRRLGAGGMAEVLEAVAVGEGGFARRVAIKRILPEHVTDPSFVRMFIDEARIASHLHHANVVGVLDFGVADGVPFQILEFVDGLDAKTLAELGLEKGAPMPIEVALHLCTDIAHALHHAHEAKDESARSLGIVHRDVSPHNFLVSWDGDVKLADFGIATARDRQEKTQTGQAKGKLSYMAPEQAMGAGVDARTDVFALGCALHALLTGKSPLADENALTKLLTGTALPLDASIPGDVRGAIEMAVHRSKGERFQSAAAMAAELGTLLAKRAQRDGRSLLREWMAKLRAPQRKRLDALLDVELVLAGQEPDGTRRFEVAPTKAVPPRRGVRLALPIAASVAIVAAVIFSGGRRAPGRGATQTAPTATQVAIASEAPSAVPTPSPRPSRTKLAAAATPAPAAFLVVAGEAVTRGEVFLDGKKIGWAHETLGATAGQHRLEVVASGKRYATTVQLLETHTRISPWKWMVAAKDEIR